MRENFSNGQKILFPNVTESWILVNHLVAYAIEFHIDKDGIHCETILLEDEARELVCAMLIKNNVRPKVARRVAGLASKPKTNPGDVCENKHGGEEMSAEAYALSDFSQIRRKIANIIRESGHDWTAYEMEVHLQITRTGNHTISARFRELKDRNLIFWTGERRKTASGRRARAYRWRVDSDPGPVGEV